MKFAEKYEIAEMVTSGRVTTFLARDRATQESLVVYTFECVGAGAKELSTASIIARFCKLAPNPPGMIVKAGFDEPSSSAFIATKMPDQASLERWVKAYQSFGQPVSPLTPAADSPLQHDPFAKAEHDTGADATMELNAFEVKSAMSKGTPKAPDPADTNASDAFALGGGAGSSKSGGEFTRLFREVNAFQPLQSSKPPAPSKTNNATDAMFGKPGSSSLGAEKPAPKPEAPAPAESSPGSFTREFMGLSAQTDAKQSASPSPAAPPKTEPGSFTREFMAFSQPAAKAPEKPAEVAPPRPAASSSATNFDSIFGKPSAPAMPEPNEAQAGPGEFTKFFQDPFEHPGAPARPISMPDITAPPPQKQAGAFTQMFGPDDVKAAMSQAPPAPVEGPNSSARSFTQIFGNTPGKGSTLGSSTLDTDPNTKASIFDRPSSPPPSFSTPRFEPPAPAPPPAATVLPPDPFRPAISSTPVAPPVNSMFSPTPAPTPAPSPMFGGGGSRPGSVDATNIFRTPSAEAPAAEPVRGGPSEFTMFLSKSQLDASLAGAGGAPPPPVEAPPPPPPPPSPFQFTPPAPPKMPKAPAIKAPKIPGLAEVPKAPASIWPLITVLVALLAIGGMLVMYFVLKH